MANGGELMAIKSHPDGTAEFYRFFPSLFFFFLFQRFALSLFSRTALPRSCARCVHREW